MYIFVERVNIENLESNLDLPSFPNLCYAVSMRRRWQCWQSLGGACHLLHCAPLVGNARIQSLSILCILMYIYRKLAWLGTDRNSCHCHFCGLQWLLKNPVSHSLHIVVCVQISTGTHCRWGTNPYYNNSLDDLKQSLKLDEKYIKVRVPDASNPAAWSWTLGAFGRYQELRNVLFEGVCILVALDL